MGPAGRRDVYRQLRRHWPVRLLRFLLHDLLAGGLEGVGDAALSRVVGLDEPRRLPAIPDVSVRCRRHLQTDLAGRCRDIAVRADVFYRSVGGHADPRHVDVAVRWPHLLGKVARGPVCRRALCRAPLQHAACAVAAIAHERLPDTKRAVQIGPVGLGYGIIVPICTSKALYLFALSTALLLLAVNAID